MEKYLDLFALAMLLFILSKKLRPNSSENGVIRSSLKFLSFIKRSSKNSFSAL